MPTNGDGRKADGSWIGVQDTVCQCLEPKMSRRRRANGMSRAKFVLDALIFFS